MTIERNNFVFVRREWNNTRSYLSTALECHRCNKWQTSREGKAVILKNVSSAKARWWAIYWCHWYWQYCLEMLYLRRTLVLYKYQKEWLGFDTVHSPLISIHIRTNASSTGSSQVVLDTSAVLAQCCLTSVYKCELVYTTCQGHCARWSTVTFLKSL